VAPRAFRRHVPDILVGRMRVLVVARAYPPFPASGAMRAAKIVDALRERGHEVVVLTAPVKDVSSRRTEDKGGVRVRAVHAPQHPLHTIIRMRRALRGTPYGNRGDMASDGPSASGHARPRLAEEVKSLLLFPDQHQAWALAATFAGLSECRNGLDMVYTSAPPFSSHLTGLALKHLTCLPWVAEFRDPWAGSNLSSGRLRTSTTTRWEGTLERIVLEEADHVVVGTEGLRVDVAQRVPTVEGKLILARNGIEKVHAASGPLRSRPELLYVGTLNQQRNPRVLFRTLAHLRSEGRITDDSLSIRFLGSNTLDEQGSYVELAERLRLTSLVRFEPWRPHPEALAAMREADFLLLIAPGQPLQVPNKLYEYLGMRKPIIALVDRDGESARMLERARGHILLDQDTLDAWSNAVLRSLEMAEEGSFSGSDPQALADWSTRGQLSRLMDSLGL
jgi:glycosyltransferase involved in cell wall biosynthesis